MMDGGASAAEWSDELDSLRFPVPGHGAACAMHRLAFKALLKEAPSKERCMDYFDTHKGSFLAAARNKIDRMNIPKDRSLHINSRDVRRAGSAENAEGPARRCRILDR